jgi:hypothetical protein
MDLAKWPFMTRLLELGREAILVDREMDFDAFDLLAAIEAAPEAARR